MTDASRDEKIAALVDRHGPLFYARFWRVVETVAERMDESDRCSVTLPWSIWSRITWASNRQQAASNLRALAEHSLINLTATDEQATCSIPNLLKIRARKKPIGNKTRTTEVEVEVDKKNIPPISPRGGRRRVEYSNEFETFWNAWPPNRRVGKPNAWKSWVRHVNGDAAKVLAAVDLHRKGEQWRRDDGRFIPHPSTWLNQRRWEDPPPVADDWQTRFLETMKKRETHDAR